MKNFVIIQRIGQSKRVGEDKVTKYICTHCNESWEGKEGMKLCPFCGEKIENEKKKINMEDIKSLEDALIFIIDNYGIKTFSIPNRVSAYLSDFIPNSLKERKLYKAADESGAVKVIIEARNKNEQEQSVAVKKAKYKLENEAFISEENAEFIVDILAKGLIIKEKKVNVNIEKNSDKLVKEIKIVPQVSEKTDKVKEEIKINNTEKVKNKPINETKADKFPQIKNAKVGDIIRFGKYEWLVLEKTTDTVLIITKDIVCHKGYNKERKGITWENCTLRSWLNNEFYNEFTAEEKAMIVNTYVENNDNPKYRTKGGNDTTDKVFLLSIEEVNKYFKDDEARIAYTNDVKYQQDGGKRSWWLRSPGYSSSFATTVGISGSIFLGGSIVNFGDDVNNDSHGVRPTLNLKF